MALALVACVRDDGFSRRLQTECINLETCSALAKEAGARSSGCRDDDQCQQERQDYAWAVGQLRRHESERAERERAEARAQEEKRRERARQENERFKAEEAARRRAEVQRQEEAEANRVKAKMAACEAKRAEEAGRSDAERVSRVEKLLSAPTFEDLCTARWQVSLMKDSKSGDAPKVAAKLDRAFKAFEAERVSDAINNRGLICRDGASSDCSCAGSHRGCCSGHGGVARCAPIEKPQPAQCPPPPDPCDFKSRVPGVTTFK